jgi:hypothetical protein
MTTVASLGVIDGRVPVISSDREVHEGVRQFMAVTPI